LSEESKGGAGHLRLSRTSAFRRFEWPEALLALLGVLPDVAVAAKAGIGRQAVAAERRRRGIAPARPRRARVEWTEEMIEWLGTDSDAAVGAHLHVHPASVTYKRRQLGIPPANPPPHDRFTAFPWQPEELTLLGKVSDGELARALGIATATVTIKRQRLGIPPFQPAPPAIEWTPAKVSRLGRAPDTEIARELGISPGSVNAKRQELGIPATLENRPIERNEELACLLNLPDTEVVRRTGVNWRTVQRLRRDLGIPEPAATSLPLQARPAGASGGDGSVSTPSADGRESRGAVKPEWRKKYRWRPEELALLGSATDEEVARRLARTVGAVRCRRQAAGVLRRRLRKWLPQEIERLGTEPDPEVARSLGRPTKAVAHKRRRLRIPPFDGLKPRKETRSDGRER
jgi:DNA-binding CsgD family transcriptional regulator